MGICCLCTRLQGPFSANPKLNEAQEKEKNEKIERMKQGPAENMTIAVLKQLLKDKGIAFSSKAKKSELVKIFNSQAGTHHNNETISRLHVKKAQKVKVLAAIPLRNINAYDSGFPKPKQFYFADEHPPKRSITT